jgi:CheY-like chemotaxis protein
VTSPASDVEARRERPPVLVVEDDPEERRLIGWVLGQGGMSVETVSNGWQALERAAQRRPAAVVLDLMLPGFHGLDVTAVLRAIHGDALPIVVVSAFDRARERARQAGSTAFVAKPFDVDDLLATVRRVIGAPPSADTG